MAFCALCGHLVDGRYCANCGAENIAGQAKPVEDARFTENIAGALCYLFGFITGFLFLAWSPYNHNKNVRFHAFQSILLTAFWFLIIFTVGIFVPGRMRYTIGRTVQLFGMVVWVYLMYMSYQNRKVVLPFIGELAEKQV